MLIGWRVLAVLRANRYESAFCAAWQERAVQSQTEPKIITVSN